MPCITDVEPHKSMYAEPWLVCVPNPIQSRVLLPDFTQVTSRMPWFSTETHQVPLPKGRPLHPQGPGRTLSHLAPPSFSWAGKGWEEPSRPRGQFRSRHLSELTKVSTLRPHAGPHTFSSPNRCIPDSTPHLVLAFTQQCLSALHPPNPDHRRTESPALGSGPGAQLAPGDRAAIAPDPPPWRRWGNTFRRIQVQAQ